MRINPAIKKLCQEVHQDDLIRELKVVLRSEESVYLAVTHGQRVYEGDSPSYTRRKAVSIIKEFCHGSAAVKKLPELKVEAPGPVPLPIAPLPYTTAVAEVAPNP